MKLLKFICIFLLCVLLWPLAVCVFVIMLLSAFMRVGKDKDFEP